MKLAVTRTTSWQAGAARRSKHCVIAAALAGRRLHEDKDIIETQQKVFDADPSYQLLAIGADAPLTYFRWLFSRKLEAEGNASRAA